MSDVGLLEADVADLSSLEAMTRQAKVLVNCVGPYVNYGEPVVKTCIESGTSHVDISGMVNLLSNLTQRVGPVMSTS